MTTAITQATSSSTFRKDIQGLRTVAVLLVLAYHAGIPQLAGGYIGVDVFFVISGFLITGLMVREVERNGRLSLKSFYARRVRRLLPATAVALAAIAAGSLLFLPATRWGSIAGDIRAAALYVVNYRFAGQAVDYLASDAAASPVQHFWSLAVEEQFYFVWPLVMVAIVAIVRRRAWLLRNALAGAIVFGIGLPSFAWSMYLTANSPATAFFVSTTRAWEFSLGAVLALVPSLEKRLSPSAAAALGWLGAAAVMIPALIYDEGTRFPGMAAVLPTVGTTALLAAGAASSADPLQRFLSTRPMQWIGALSYSMYLWHWPAVVFATALWSGDEGLPVAIGIAAIAVSMIPAWLTYRYVEAPIHYAPRFARVPRQALSLALSCTIIGVAAGMAVTVLVPTNAATAITATAPSNSPADQAPTARGEPGQPDSPAEGQPAAVAIGAAALGDLVVDPAAATPTDDVGFFTPSPVAALEDLSFLGGSRCIQGPRYFELEPCDYGPSDADTVIAVVGDSKMAQWLPAIGTIADSHGWRIVTYLVAGCALARVPVKEADSQLDACEQYNEDRYAALLTDPDIDFVLTSQRAPTAFIPEIPEAEQRTALVDDLRNTWSELEMAGREVIVLLDNAPPLRNVPECAIENLDQLTNCTFDLEEALAASGSSSQRAALADAPGIDFVDLQDWICPVATCPIVIGNVLVYRQGSHLTATYVKTLTPYLERALLEIIQSP